MEAIPNVGEVEIDEATASYSGKSKDCCIGGWYFADGVRIKEGTLSLSFELDEVDIWGLPDVDDEFYIDGVLKASVTFELGIELSVDATVEGTVGHGWDDCADTDWTYGSFGADIALTLEPECEMSYCLELLWWEKCGSIEVSASASSSIAGEVTYNSPDGPTDPAIGGSLSMGDITFEATAKIGSLVGCTLSYTIEMP